MVKSEASRRIWVQANSDDAELLDVTITISGERVRVDTAYSILQQAVNLHIVPLLAMPKAMEISADDAEAIRQSSQGCE